jgi:hypothetical protein
LHKAFFFRFRLLSNQTGRPIDNLSEGASDASWRRIFANAFKKKPKNQTEAIQDVIVTLEAAKKKWLSAGKKPKPVPSYSTIRNDMIRLGFFAVRELIIIATYLTKSILAVGQLCRIVLPAPRFLTGVDTAEVFYAAHQAQRIRGCDVARRQQELAR